MNITQLRTLVRRGESDRVEFKSSTGSLNSGMQTICAFLNSDHGGAVIFGVKDDGKIVGQEVTDKTRKDLATEINKIEPQAKINIEFLKIKDKLYVVIAWVESGKNAPYSYDGRPFMRNQSTTIKMPKEEYISLHNTINPEEWESLANNHCTVKDLDHIRIKEVVRAAVARKRLPHSALDESIPSILKKLHLIADQKLTNAAVILFCKDEQKEFIQSNIKVARFRGIDKTEFIDAKMYRANAFDLYEKADQFLSLVLPVAARIVPGQAERVETPKIPYVVLREALVNALVHRDYSHRGGSIDVAVYDDRVEIANSGFLMSGVHVTELTKNHKSVLRNPLIAHVFYICGNIEKWGRGTLEMARECKSAGNPAPQFEEIGGGFLVTLPFKESLRTIIYDKIPQSNFNKITDRQKEIISILKTAGALKRSEIMARMTTPLTDRTIQLELSALKQLGLIKSEGRSRSSIWSLID